jgi:hypothetical protein
LLSNQGIKKYRFLSILDCAIKPEAPNHTSRKFIGNSNIAMKNLLISFSSSSRGFVLLTGFCFFSLLLLHLPPLSRFQQADADRDSFPDRRRGGGSHWILDHESEVVANAAVFQSISQISSVSGDRMG